MRMAEYVLKGLRDFAAVAVSVAVLAVTFSFNRWQRRLASEQLRHQLYERRMAAYSAFRELLLALPEKNGEEIKDLFRKAHLAGSEIPFLFEDDKDLQTYVDQLLQRVRDEVVNAIPSLEVMKQEPDMLMSPAIAKDLREQANQFFLAKLKIPGEHFTQLPQKFGPYLRLTDFKKR